MEERKTLDGLLQLIEPHVEKQWDWRVIRSYAQALIEQEAARVSAAPAVPQEPIAWLYEDTLPDAYPYDEMFPHSSVRSGVRMFPVFAAPSPSLRIAGDAAGVDVPGEGKTE